MLINNSHDHRMESVLNHAFSHSVVLLEAAPGYGKSEMVQKFLEKKGKKYAWIRLRGLDNHLFFNWSQLIKALSKLMPNQASRFAKLETPTTLGQIAELIELIERGLLNRERRILVLDDYSMLQDEKILFLYENLIEHNFTNLCIVVISNQKSGIRKTCARSHTDYVYIDEEILGFTDLETHQLFEENGLSLSSEQITSINQKWNGWPLPLIVLAVDSQTVKEVTSNSLDKIQQLFYSQFFSDYTIEQRKCLVQLSVLEEIPSELFGSLSEENDFLGKHPFLFYDFKKDMYSFQKAYGEFLKERYTILNEAEKQHFYTLAAEAFLKRGRKEEALALFSYGQQYDQVVEQIWESFTPYIEHSQARFLYNYSEKLPGDYLDFHPDALFQKVSLMFYLEKIEEMEACLYTMIERYSSEAFSDRTALGNAYHILSQIDRMNGKECFLEHARLASVYLSSVSRYPIPALIKAPWTRFPRYEEGASDQLEQSKKVFKLLNEYLVKVSPDVDYHEDKFCVAEIAFHQYDLKIARITLLEILHLIESDQLSEMILLVHHYLMRTELLRGNLIAAKRHLKTVTKRIQDEKQYQYNGFQARMASWLALYLHQPNEVPTRVTKNDIKMGAKWELVRNGFPQAKYLIQTNQYEEAIALLGYLDDHYSKHPGLWLSTMNVKIFRAVAHLKMDEQVLAINDLEAAYRMSHGNKIITPFIEWEEEMRHLIHIARTKTPEKFDSEWLTLVYAKSTTLAKRVSKICKQQMREKGAPSLTPRRIEILTDLAQGLTSEEIAEERNISVNTVHSHIKNIYRDLGAINRADAIRIATQNHLI